MSTPILEVDGVTQRFGKFTALSDVSASFEAGKLTAIIGPNGAGKSTFFNVVSGAFAPSAGRIRFQGRDITGLPQHAFARIDGVHWDGRSAAIANGRSAEALVAALG